MMLQKNGLVIMIRSFHHLNLNFSPMNGWIMEQGWGQGLFSEPMEVMCGVYLRGEAGRCSSNLG